MKLAIDRIPRAVRELSLAEFIDDFGADIHAFMEKAPVQRLEEGRKEWAKLTENSPVKGKRAKKDEEDDESSNKEEATSNLGKSGECFLLLRSGIIGLPAHTTVLLLLVPPQHAVGTRRRDPPPWKRLLQQQRKNQVGLEPRAHELL